MPFNSIGFFIAQMEALNAHCLGVDHTKLTYRYQGRDFRLTDVEGRVIREVCA